MARKKMSVQQKKFKKAQSTCHKTTNSSSDFGKCMSKELSKKAKSKGKKK